MEQAQIKKTVCMGCHSHCSVAVHIEDGHLIRVDENQARRGKEILAKTIRGCPRILHAPDWFHHPDRLNYPLKRKGERGEGKWQQISWEQALDEIAAKLGDIREKHGAEAVADSSGTGRTHDEYRSRFLNLFGSPNHVGQGHICFGPTCAVSSYIFGGSFWSPLRKDTKCILVWGTNPHQAMRRAWLSITESKEAGAKLIVIDPRRMVPAEGADMWLQIRPGTDCALAMAMINVIIADDLYDKEFVDKWCYGFSKFAERVKEYSPEKVAEITWIPADIIKEVARIYATSKPAIVYTQMGMEQLPNSIQALHARYTLPVITGNLDVKGGELIRRLHPKVIKDFDVELNHKLSPEQQAKQIGSDRFKLEGYPGYYLRIEGERKVGSEVYSVDNCFAHAPSVYEAMITGKPYPVRSMISAASNPLATQADVKRVYKGLMNLDLYVVMDYWMTPSAEIADYVLPAASWLERPVLWSWWSTSAIIEAGEAALPHQIEGKYDRRRDYDLWRGLGIRLGQEEYWPWETLEDAYSYRLAPLGYNLERFIAEKDGIDYPQLGEKMYEQTGFGTLTGKVELYSTLLEKLGYDPLPKYEEPAESPSNTELAKGYPLILVTGGRHQPFYHSEYRQVNSLRKIHPHPLLQINPNTASELGISDGDWVWIETPRGRVRQKCKYFDGIDPRVVHAEHGWWFPELPGEEPWLHGIWESNINIVTSGDPEHCNQINGGWPLRTLICKVYKIKEY
ncbi:molybdopterin-dependent oxidoreductase [Chloroflexota bacterium]